jgi:hypothetical protein
MLHPPKDKQIGQILLHEGLIDERQLEEALSRQKELTTYKPLGEVLRTLGFVSRRALRDVLLRYRKQIPLGELLMKMGVISSSQLSLAVNIQGDSRKKLGQILVDMGYITHSHLTDALCTQLGIEGMDLAPLVDKGLLDKTSVTFLRNRRVLPLRLTEENHLLVLMEDPSDRLTIMDLEKVFRAEVEPIMFRGKSLEYLFDGVLDIWYATR